MRNRRNKRSNNFCFKNLKNISRILVFLIIIFSLIFMLSIIKKINGTILNNRNISDTDINLNNEVTSSNTTDSDNTEINKDITIKMAFTGDIMCHNTMYKDAYDSTTGTYDFTHFFENVKYYLQTADVTVGNLETTFAGSKIGYSSYPTFNTPEILAKNLGIGFSVAPIKDMYDTTENCLNNLFTQVEKSWDCRYKQSFSLLS